MRRPTFWATHPVTATRGFLSRAQRGPKRPRSLHTFCSALSRTLQPLRITTSASSSPASRQPLPTRAVFILSPSYTFI